ncbi:hypothetical protein X797_012265 [Metarhizium robertsii]|uniref:Uncharacterized protein n=1 Tax=Metarhizium robertsii TaxID=568076 RepID=A0A014MU89_9HYPO|nr:hypothetical protein X797_012265 [Metarhizium robertsii]
MRTTSAALLWCALASSTTIAIQKHELENPAKKPLPATEANVLHRRRDRIIEWERIDCGPGPNQWDPADIEQIAMGIQHLSGLAGKPGNGPGPGNCGRVSCSWGASIWWCNDNATPYQLDGWEDIVEGAKRIFEKCTEASSEVLGQAFAKDGWNVIIRHDTC